jgi:hypothetical protein
MVTRADDRYRAFVDGWTALEIFVNKAFQWYEKRFAAKLEQELPSAKRYLERIRVVMKDKYRLADKFAIIAGELNTESSGEEDIKLFQAVKSTRDRLLHGEQVSDSQLPSLQLQQLLEKYLDLHISKLGKSGNTKSA